MAYVLTYNTLIPSLLDYVERDDAATTAALPLLIMLAQQRIARDTKTLFLETYVTNAFTNGSNVLQKPANWLNTITFNVGSNVNNNTRSQVQLASYEKCRQYAPDDTVTGLPKYYCDYGYDNWLIVPTPDQDYPFEIAYQGTAIPIDATVQTNQITQKAPELLFYACLIELYNYLKDNNNFQVCLNLYQTSLTGIKSESEFRQSDRYTVRNKD